MNKGLRSKIYELVQLMFLGSLLFLAACGPSSNNIFEQPPGSSERNSTSQPLSTQNLSQLHPLWTYTFDPSISGKMVVENGIVYSTAAISDSSYNLHYSLIAIQNGKLLWRYQIPDHNHVISHIQVGGGIVYLAVWTRISPYTDNAIYAVNAHTGRELWHHSSERNIDQLIYARGRLYCSTDREVHALDAQTGKLQWSYQFTDGSSYSPFSPSLAVDAESLYISLSTSPYRAGIDLIALDGGTGKVRWQRSELGGVTTWLVVDSGVAYRRVHYWSQAYRLSAFNAKTGKQLWDTSVSSPGSEFVDDMKVAHNLLYMRGARRIQAFSVGTGRLMWSTELEGNAISVGPIVGNGVVYVSTETPRESGWHLFGPPSRAHEWLYALNAQTGKVVRVLQNADTSFKSEELALDNEHLYVSGSRTFIGSDDTANGKPDLYALGI